MIKLNVAEYCHECPEFEVEIEKNTVEVYDFDELTTVEKTDTIVKCANCEMCDKIRQYLAKYGILKGN